MLRTNQAVNNQRCSLADQSQRWSQIYDICTDWPITEVVTECLKKLTCHSGGDRDDVSQTARRLVYLYIDDRLRRYTMSGWQVCNQERTWNTPPGGGLRTERGRRKDTSDLVVCDLTSSLQKFTRAVERCVGIMEAVTHVYFLLRHTRLISKQ